MVRLCEEWRGVKEAARFGSLKILGWQFRIHDDRGVKNWAVVVECDCGRVKIIARWSIFSGASGSCGCSRKWIPQAFRKTHGATNTSLYNVWHGMKARCSNPNNTQFRWYGARGIGYCDEWRRFEPFRDWALSNGYQEGLQLDRERNSEGYSPGNCRFVTSLVNNRNRRGNRSISAFGESKTIAEWAEDSRCEVRYFTLAARFKHQWPAELAITSPLGTLLKQVT